MQIKKNVDLSKKCTFHIGGIAKNYYIPESENDLAELYNNLKNKKIYILSNGSNILINDKKKFEHVLYVGELDKNMIHIQDDLFYIGCSNKIQSVINFINSLGYGGIEELYSIPALFGGIIYMNAGIGGKNNVLVSIADVISRVKVFNKKTCNIEWIEKKDCYFGHRKSVFQNDEYIILGAQCHFITQSLEKSKERIHARINLVKNIHEWGKGTFGTVFSSSDTRLLKLISKIIPRKGHIHFGKHNKNWMVNEGNGKFKDIIFLINICKIVHRMVFKNIECEVRIWK